MLSMVAKFLSYWYLRYLMITELYMVEKWERHVAHATLALLFALTYYVNVNFVLTGIGAFLNAVGFSTLDVPS